MDVAEARRRLGDAAASYDHVHALQIIASEELDQAILSARDAGLTYPEIAEIADMTTGAVTQRSRSARGVRSTTETLGRPRASDPTIGESVAEAANRLGISRALVYRRIRQGRFEAVEDEHGYTRVISTDDAVSH